VLPNQIKVSLTSWLKESYGTEAMIISMYSVGGGSINQAVHLKTTPGDFFVKFNSRSKYPGMFGTEKRGLTQLGATKTLTVPKVEDQQETEDYSYLMLEWMESITPNVSMWEEAGQKLAMLHQHSASGFGLDYDNYIGSLNQVNTRKPDWIDFLISFRLEPLMKHAFDEKLFNRNDFSAFEKLCSRLPQLLPIEKPSLLHGDLWSGNFMVSRAGPCLIDPAIYYGHREIDIAMTRLFSGFSPAFYEAYNSTFPLESGWQQRIELNQLYPLLVHVNLFGSGYTGSVRSVLRSYN
jgi:fructosamine-3-kinase